MKQFRPKSFIKVQLAWLLRGEEYSCNAGDAVTVGLIPGSGRSPGGGNGNPLQYSCLENPMDRGAWWATVHGVTQSQTQLSTYKHMEVFIAREACSPE